MIMLRSVSRVVVTMQSGIGITTVGPESIVVHDQMDGDGPRGPR